MPYHVNPSKIAVLQENDPAAYRPLLDFVTEGEKLAEEAELAESWTQAKKCVLAHLGRLRDLRKQREGKPTSSVQPSLFRSLETRPEPPHLQPSALERKQAKRFGFRELRAMRQRIEDARMEDVDSRHINVPF